MRRRNHQICHHRDGGIEIIDDEAKVEQFSIVLKNLLLRFVSEMDQLCQNSSSSASDAVLFEDAARSNFAISSRFIRPGPPGLVTGGDDHDDDPLPDAKHLASSSAFLTFRRSFSSFLAPPISARRGIADAPATTNLPSSARHGRHYF